MEISINELNAFCKDTLIEHLGIEFTEIGEGFLKATMPVNEKTIQPMNILHGGAIMALAETIGSAGSYLMVDRRKYDVVGIEVNGNHVGNTKTKSVYAVGKLIHAGQRTHVWGVDIFDELDILISVCRITNMVIEKD